MPWKPRSFPQQEALACPADILLFGGAAGSLKSETMLVDAVQECQRPALRAIMLRRSFPELEKSLIRRSRELYPGFGGEYNEQKKLWRFPSGGTVEFGYCEAEKDIYRYQGAAYTFIGVDESTHFSEFPIRYMLSRLRSTDPGMRLRMRLASNPGNVGHNAHKGIFLGPTCTHCAITERSRLPFRLYHDARWPSDQHRIGKSTCFIPGRLSDHNLLGVDYSESLASLPEAFRKALLEGCWDALEGQYFDGWDPGRMTIARREVGADDWWPHWVGIDYGFAGSQAVAYLLCRSPASAGFPGGRAYVLEELAAKHATAADFAAEVKRRFCSGARRIQSWYLSPDAWNKRGDGHTLADQMTEASGIGFEPASNDRIGGAMLLYTKLARGELVIADSCRELIRSIPTRIHDPKRPDDILKVVGDPLDDCIDALRYAVYSYVQPARKPVEIAAMETVTARDPTIAMVQRRLAEERIRRASEPATYMGAGRGRGGR